MKYQYHVDGTKPLAISNWVFVFGSNLGGFHGAGAAHLALIEYGAKYGIGIGRQGRSYAIPTKDAKFDVLPIFNIDGQDIGDYAEQFMEYAEDHPDLTFFVTRVGCGLAGYKDSDIAPLFRGAPTNCDFAEQWKEFLE